MKSCTAPHKTAARFGGDEFVLMIYGAESEEELQGYLDQLYSKIIQTFIHVPGGETRPVRMSGGYVFYPEYKEDYREMLRLADQTMYQVKNGEKGYFKRYQPDSE